MLRKAQLFILVLLVVLLVYVEAKGKKKDKNGMRNKQQAKDCSEWTFGECTLNASSSATCGKGSKKGTRTGDNCAMKEKTFPCRVPCVKNKCKYQKGEWSECDLTTNMMSRTNILKKGDATLCQASKVITKKCKNKKTVNRESNRKRKQPASDSI